MKYRLLAVDLDGTLLSSAGVPHDEDADAIRRLAGEGVHVTILTGRLYSGTRQVAKRLDLRGPVGCVDGGHVVHAHTDQTLFHHALPAPIAQIVRESLSTHDIAAFVFADDVVLHESSGRSFLSYVTTWSEHIREVPSLTEHPVWAADGAITAVVAIGSMDQILDAARVVQEKVGSNVQIATFPTRRIASAWGMLLRAAAGTKGTALHWIAEHHGIAIEETVVVGDWLNDVPMFHAAARSFAMAHAPDEVKRAATDVLDRGSEEGGGVAEAIRRAFGLANR